MQNANNGVEAAFRQHVQSVYRLCYSYMGNAADAEDATQTAFMKLIDKQAADTTFAFSDEEHEKAWLLRVAANHCKDVLKSAARTRTTELVEESGSRDVEQAAAEQVPGIQLSDEGASEVLQAVLELPSIYKDCVYLHYYEGYKTDEIARMTETKPSTVRNRLSDARALLRKALEA